MLDIIYLLKALDRTTLEEQIHTKKLMNFRGIILLKNQSKLLSDYIYVGTYSDGLEMLKKSRPDTPVTFFLSAEDVNNTRLPSSKPHNLIVSTLDIIDIYNRINIIIESYHHWTNSLMEARCTGKNLQQILALASDMIQSQIYILNPGYRIIAKNGKLFHSDPLSTELENNGYLSFETSIGLNTRSHSKHAANNYKKIVIEQTVYHLCEIRRDYSLFAIALLPENPNAAKLDFQYLITDLAEIIENFLSIHLDDAHNQDIYCVSFISDIVEGHLKSMSEIQNRIRFLPYPLKDFLCFIRIHFDEKGMEKPPYDYVMQELQTIFPQTNMALYQNDIVILYSQKERPQNRLDFDYDKFEILLKNCNAYAGISNSSRHLERLRTLYLTASATVRLGRAFHRKECFERIFAYEDYSMYYIIDLCAQQYMETHKNNDLIYLIHPSIIKIGRYDAQHNTNLREVLYFYLLCGCNLGRTAKAMYMHRNTILNKLNKINEIIQIPLEDGYTQQRMLISCMIASYYEEYLNMTIQL